MKELKLTKGKVALVDDEDYEYLNQWKWHADESHGNYYAKTTVRISINKRKNIKMHRLLLGLNDPNVVADHISGDGLDNRRCNLRICTNTENCRNSKKPIRGVTSSFKGVSLNKQSNRYKARIRVDRKLLFLGYYATQEEAAIAYNTAAEKHFGSFANLNVLCVG